MSPQQQFLGPEGCSSNKQSSRKNLESRASTWYLEVIEIIRSCDGFCWFPISAGFFLEKARGTVR